MNEARLLHYLRKGEAHSALLFSGPGCQEKRELAKRLALGWLCQRPRSAGHCGSCSACRRIEKGLHPDLVWVGEEEQTHLKIETIRALCRQMELGPIEAPVKVAIIDEAQRMNASAQNAFLKTLEEPGEGRYFWLLSTQPASLLATVRSRCVEFHFPPGPTHFTMADREDLERLLEEALLSQSVSGILSAVEKDKDRAVRLTQVLQTELRDAVYATVRGSSPKPLFARLGLAALVRKFQLATELEGRLRSNASHGLMLESFLRQEFFA